MQLRTQVVGDDFVLVSREDDCTAADPIGLLGEISDAVDELTDDFWPINQKIHDHPELGFRERIAHDALTGYLRGRAGWKVTPSAYNMQTAWVAVFDSYRPGPVVSFNAEMDSLPGIGHACGHNLIATASVVGAVVTAEMMRLHDMPGKVVLFGTPAEEGGGGKIRLLKAGAYANHGVDVSLISHPEVRPDAALMRTTASLHLKVEYFGREAHAAANPWLGINALDALVAAYTNISMLRQQTRPTDVIQGYFTHAGVATNVIHAYAAGSFSVRAATQSRLEELKEKVVACFEAGALATGARLKITQTGAYKDHVPNRTMARIYGRYFNALHPPHEIAGDQDVDEARGRTQASTDQGDVSYAMPSLSPVFSLRPGPGGMGPHNPEFAAVAGTRDAFTRALRVAKALAALATDVLVDDGLLEEVKREWRETVKKTG